MGGYRIDACLLMLEQLEILGILSLPPKAPSKQNFGNSKKIIFPSGPLAIGDMVPIQPEGEIQAGNIKVKLFSPTRSVMDRLAWFYFSNDMQYLDQAIMICRNQPVSIETVRKWSNREGMLEQFDIFIQYLKG